MEIRKFLFLCMFFLPQSNHQMWLVLKVRTKEYLQDLKRTLQLFTARICLCANRLLTVAAAGIHTTVFFLRHQSKSIFKRLVRLSYESDAAKIYRRRKSLSAERLHLHKMSLSATITHVRRAARITFFCKRGCKTNAVDNRFDQIFLQGNQICREFFKRSARIDELTEIFSLL